jgi:hypothetical protein
LLGHFFSELLSDPEMLGLDDPRWADERLSTKRAWSALSSDDKQMYLTLRRNFLQRTTSTDIPNTSRFYQDIQAVTTYINRSPDNRETRAIVVGLAMSGQFLAVNTRQLKNLLGRCKSSINGCLRHLGYFGFNTKQKSRNCVLDILPSLKTDPGALRQWTARFLRSGRPSRSPSDGSPVPMDGNWDEGSDGKGGKPGQPETSPYELDIFAGMYRGQTAAGWSEDELQL